MDKLKSIQITDRYGAVYGVEPPSRSLISDTVNELIQKLEDLEYQSEYLICKFGKRF